MNESLNSSPAKKGRHRQAKYKRPRKALLVMTVTAKMLLCLVFFALLSLSWAQRDQDPCPSIKYVDYNADRIPSRITSLYCITDRIIGQTCDLNAKVLEKY